MNRPINEILSDIAMRAAQLASGDYKACGIMAEEIGKEILILVREARGNG